MIVSVGSTYFDQFIQVKRLPKRGRSTVVLDRYEHPGGYEANAVSWIAQLCEPVFFYTALARDIHGKQL